MSDVPIDSPSFLEVRVARSLDGQRIDNVLSAATALSRSQASRRIKDGDVTLNDQPVRRPATKVSTGDHLVVRLPPSPTEHILPSAQALPLALVFEDEDILVVNKAPGMVIHPSAAHREGTLAHALLHHAPEIAALGEPHRPGIVHRIDKDTSGIVAVARSPRAFEALSEAFAEQRPERRYLALAARTHGEGLDDHGTIESLHGRSQSDRRRFTGAHGTRTAITHYRVLERFEHGALLVECHLQTGRTHQIRMHLREQGVPILGDALYGGGAVDRFGVISRTALHAASLTLELPWMERRRFDAEPPSDFAEAVAKLRKGPPY